MKFLKGILYLGLLCSAMTTNAALLTSSDSSLAFWYDNDINNRGGIALANNQLLGTINPYTTNAFTVSFHLNITGARSGWSSILHVGNTNFQRWPGFWLTPGNTGLHSRMSTSSSWNNGFADTAPLPIGPNAWTHVAMIDDGSALKLYLNGSLFQTIDGSGTPYSPSGPINVYAGDPWYNPSLGSIDDIRIYNRAVQLNELRVTPAQVPAPASLALFLLGVAGISLNRLNRKPL
ncbi:LamG domain-containing protein [Alteromonas sp. ASW11-19]|uniref:LamG domain-containing protein n=1 Tax=Alteromonas salexigens TaxID=2982530 RepID=A0ABT2VN16_9ALTE|nr:LamG domain-containing protein [Alteromonas salexigens]MCU7554490.1 LamG domain-containing protein [Alteromonas salexigens]